MSNLFILIAEDDADDRYLLETAFTECGFHDELLFVENGVELFEFLDKNSNGTPVKKVPVFILLDLNMPKKDGREVLKELKEHPKFKKIPVVVFTTTKNQNEIRRCYELGANTYVVKPPSFDDLVSVVNQIRTYWLTVAATPGASDF